MKNEFPLVNCDRIQEKLKELASFGLNSEGGIDRCFGSKADLEVRHWFQKQGTELGSNVNIDAIANIWITAQGVNDRLKPIVIGSHLDAVPNGGKFDGTVGVVLGLEIMRIILENKISLRHSLQVVSFTAEEPNPYNISTMGSRSITGKIDKTFLSVAFHSGTKEPLSSAIFRAGGNINNLDDSLLHKGDMAAFVECHIEQGRNLFDKGNSIGLVNCITGIYREEIEVDGESNHAGTTLMRNRHDAFLASAEAALALEKTIIAQGSDKIVGTVGKISIEPNAPNIIPGKAKFVMEIRTQDDDIKNRILNIFTCLLNNISRNRGVLFTRKIILNQEFVCMSPIVMNAINSCSKEKLMVMPSMAGHDSVHMTNIAPTGMLFVQSIEGMSHCAEERTEIKDICVAGNTLLHTILKLDEILDKNEC